MRLERLTTLPCKISGKYNVSVCLYIIAFYQQIFIIFCSTVTEFYGANIFAAVRLNFINLFCASPFYFPFIAFSFPFIFSIYTFAV